MVHLLGEEDRLTLREVDVVWRRAQTVLVRGLHPGDLLIQTRVPTPVEGTQLRRIEDDPPDGGSGG